MDRDRAGVRRHAGLTAGVIPGRREAERPESIAMVRNLGHDGSNKCGYGFRARELCSRPGMTTESEERMS
jgi:hypothetical protein